MLHVTELKTIRAKIAYLKAGNMLDVSLSNGIITSSKEAGAYQDDSGLWTFYIFHDIDGVETNFSEAAFIEVLKGGRSPWDGDYDSL